MNSSLIKGIIPPILTPMYDDESVNYDELRNQIEREIKAGVHGIFCFGTNGEGYILSEDEKVEILRQTVDKTAGRVPVYAGTGCISTSDTIRLSKKAQQAGADILSIVTPSYALASQKRAICTLCRSGQKMSIFRLFYTIYRREREINFCLKLLQNSRMMLIIS